MMYSRIQAPRVWCVSLGVCLLVSSASQAIEKQAVPDAIDLEIAEEKVKSLFRADYGSRKPEVRLQLARKLLDLARDSSSESPATQFVLLREARSLAVDGKDISTALESAQLLAERFEVDAWVSRVEVVTGMARTVRRQEDARRFLGAVLSVVDRALASGGKLPPEEILKSAESIARRVRSPWLSWQIERREEQLDLHARWQARVKQAEEDLAGDPDDPEANLVVGKYHALVSGDWEKALPKLARSGLESLQKAINLERDIAISATGGEEKCGDSWYLAATGAKGGEDGELQSLMQARAAYWYTKAQENVSGVRNLQIEQKLNRVAKRRYLSDMEEFEVTMAHGNLGKNGALGWNTSARAPDLLGLRDKPPVRNRIVVEGLPSENGLSMHPLAQQPCQVKYRIGRRFDEFEAFVALNDTARIPQGKFVFAVLGDGKLLWKSGTIREPGRPQRCSVSIDGVDVLEIQLHCTGRAGWGHGVWLEPVVRKES